MLVHADAIINPFSFHRKPIFVFLASSGLGDVTHKNSGHEGSACPRSPHIKVFSSSTTSSINEGDSTTHGARLHPSVNEATMATNKIDDPELQPLLEADLAREDVAPPTDQDGTAKGPVEFDIKGDADNPLEWPAAFKWAIVALLSIMAFTMYVLELRHPLPVLTFSRTFTCLSVVPVANRIVDDLSGGTPDRSASTLLVTIWELGEAAGPLFIAPLSEIYGRYPAMNAANTLFVAATVLAAISPSVQLFVAARALTGLAVATNVLGPAIVGDMFISEQRGTAMSIITLAPLIGGAVGPAVGGAVAETLGWRSVLWLAAGMAGVCEILFLMCFTETYKGTILKRRAAKMRVESGDVELRSGRTYRELWAFISRPASVFFGSGVLFVLSLHASVVFTTYYVMCISLPDILEDIYGLSPSLAGSTFICFSKAPSSALLTASLQGHTKADSMIRPRCFHRCHYLWQRARRYLH